MGASSQSPSSSEFLAACRAVASGAAIVDDPQIMAGHLADGLGKHAGRALAVLRPSSTEEAAQLVQLCRRHGVAIVPQGGNTGFCGGAIPSTDGAQVVMSLGRMRRIRRLDPAENTIAVDAGCSLRQVQEAAAEAGRHFPLSHGGEETSQIGGNISTNAGGNAVLRYGTMRGLVLGLEVILPDGSILDLMRRLRKDTAGYDLKQLFIGAEGTLGLVTGAVLKLFPRHNRLETAIAALPGPEAAVALLARLQATIGEAITGFELMPRLGIELHFAHAGRRSEPTVEAHPWYALIEAGAASPYFDLARALEENLGAAISEGEARDAVLARSETQRRAFWSLREGLAVAQVADRSAIKNDTSVPVSEIPRFLRLAQDLVQAALPGTRPVPFGHVGDGNIHYNLVRPDGMAPADFIARWPELVAAVEAAALACGGSIAAEHGIGRAKRLRLAEVRDGETEIMRRIKAALDPAGLFNPGSVI